MKSLILLLLGLSATAVTAQELDTLFANQNHNTAVFFPAKIRQGVVGSKHYIFSYNEEHPQYFGLLKAVPGPPSNLLVITEKGGIFSFVVAYKKSLPRLNYFLEESSSLGNERPGERGFTAEERPSPEAADSIRAFEKVLERRASYYLETATGRLKARRKYGMLFQVNKVAYYENEVYLVLEIENRSGITYETALLRVFLRSGNNSRNASFQRLPLAPRFTLNFPKEVLHGQRLRFVYVLPKFTLGDKEELELVLREAQGNRVLHLQLRSF